MDHSLISLLLEYVWVPILAAISWAGRKHLERIDDLEVSHDKLMAQINTHKMESLTNYVTRQELKDTVIEFKETQEKSSDRIEKQLEEYRQDFREFHRTFTDYLQKNK